MAKKLSQQVIQVARAIRDTYLARDVWANPLAVLALFLLPPVYLADRAFRLRYRGLTFFVRKLDWNAVDEVLLKGEYDEVLKAFIGMEKMVLLDLGANVGAFSLRAFSLDSDAVVHAVEPSWGTYRILEKNCAANPRLAWHTHRYALWDQNGMMSFSENTAASTGSFLDPDGDKDQVPAIRLATLIEQHIQTPVDIIKMDIEGAEEVVLFDSLDILKNAQGIVLEIHHYRCDEAKIRRLLHDEFPFVYEITGRISNKPLLVASRKRLSLVHAVLAETPDATAHH